MLDLIFVQIDQILSDYFDFYNNERPHEATGHRTKSILERGRRWRRLRRPWFNMDQIEIVTPGANGEAVFRDAAKNGFRLQDRIK